MLYIFTMSLSYSFEENNLLKCVLSPYNTAHGSKSKNNINNNNNQLAICNLYSTQHFPIHFFNVGREEWFLPSFFI